MGDEKGTGAFRSASARARLRCNCQPSQDTKKQSATNSDLPMIFFMGSFCGGWANRAIGRIPEIAQHFRRTTTGGTTERNLGRQHDRGLSTIEEIL